MEPGLPLLADTVSHGAPSPRIWPYALDAAFDALVGSTLAGPGTHAPGSGGYGD